MALYLTHADCEAHATPAGHPESPARLSVLNQHLDRCGLLNDVECRSSSLASFEDIARVHDQGLIDLLIAVAPKTGLVRIDADTAFSPRSLDAVRRCVGAVCDGVHASLAGEETKVFCGVRPPGHHAESNGSMGFCIFNSIAVGAALALEQVERVAILDFDAHHGNGTVEIFQDDPRVLVCSSFQYPFYPYRFQDVDRPNIVNVPMSAGSGSETFRNAVTASWQPAIEAHQPELFLVSAGFDAHEDDPLTQLSLVDEDYRWITQNIVVWADHFAQGRVVSVLEGGYDLDALCRCGEIHLGALV